LSIFIVAESIKIRLDIFSRKDKISFIE